MQIYRILLYTSPNAPEKRDVLGTMMLSVPAGHKHYAHITALRNDGVLPELLGMKKIVSEDAVRRGIKSIGEDEGRKWLQHHLDYCSAPLLSEPWVMDTDSAVKPLYGHQEGAVLGYNPKKPGRPSHVYHTYTLAGLRLVLDAGVAPGRAMLQSMQQPDCGRSWTAFHAIASRRFCAAIVASVRRR